MVGRAESFTVDAKRPPFEEENQHLREAVSALRGAARTERGRREGVERECNLLLGEFSRLQTRVQVRNQNQNNFISIRRDKFSFDITIYIFCREYTDPCDGVR